MLSYLLTVSARVCVLFLQMALGYILYHRGMIDQQTSGKISELVVKITTPITIIISYPRAYDPQTAGWLLSAFLLSAICYLVMMLIIPLIFPKKAPYWKQCCLCSVFSNCGAIGIPLLSSLLGPIGVFLGSGYIVITSILQWTYGVYMLTNSRANISLKKLLLNPGTIPAYVGLVLFFTPVKLPPILYDAMDAVGLMNTPLAMILLGVYIAQADLVSCFTNLWVYLVSGLRLLAFPLLIFGILTLVPIEPTIRMALLIGAASPCGMSVSMLSQLYDCDYLFPSKCVVVTTLLSILTAPFILSLANSVW